MGTSPNRSYPYPAGSDAVDVPGDMEALADAVDADMAAVIAGTGLADGAVTDAKLAVPKVDQSVVGNLLTANQATGTDTLGTTTGFVPIGVTAASSTDYAKTGARSVQVTRPAASDGVGYGVTLNIRSGNNPATGGGTMPVTPGQTYTFSFWQYAPTSTGNTQAYIWWWQADGTTAALTAYNIGTASAASASWKLVQVTAVAPNNAAFASMYARNTGNSNEVIYFDTFSFHQGAGGLWAPPGTPIANLGIRANPADATQAQVWNPGNNTWITV